MVAPKKKQSKQKIVWSVVGIIIVAVFVIGIVNMSNNKKVSSEKNKTKKLSILTYANWNPFEFVNNGKVVGFDLDLLKALSKEAGYDYTVKNTGWDAMFTQLHSGSVDAAISGITITSDRQKSYDFSNPYFVSRQAIVTKKDNTSIKTALDLKGKKIAVQTGSTGQAAAESILGKHNSNISADNGGTTNLQVVHGQATAAIGDETTVTKYVASNPSYNLKIIYDDKNFKPEYFGMMFPKNSPYRSDYNTALKKIIDNGEYTKIYLKWFDNKPALNLIKARQGGSK